MEVVESYNVKIWLGLKDMSTKKVYKIKDVEKVLQKLVNGSSPDCYSLTKSKYIYTNGCEDGVFIGLINYPRFKREKKEIIERARETAFILMLKFNQYRVTITTPEKTYMLKNEM